MKKVLLGLFLFSIHVIWGQLFTEVSDAVGIDYRYEGNSFQVTGGGVLVLDFNNDGWDDIFQCSGIFQSKLWKNNKGVFEDVTAEFGLDTILRRFYAQSAISADYDNDGYVDFVVLNHGKAYGRGDNKSPVLLHNIQGERFEVVSLDSLLPPGFYTAGTWGDFNNDGYADLYVTNYIFSMGGEFDLSHVDSTLYDPVCLPNKLLLNNSGKGFTECAAKYGLDDDGCGFAALFTDYDSDGDVDLMVLNDFGAWSGKGNRLFRNEYREQRFTDVSEATNINQKIYGMGIGPGDVNGDGRLDYYLTNIGSNYLMENQEQGFSDKSEEYGIKLTYAKDNILGTSWSGLFFDYEMDGDLDLYVAKGHVFSLLPKTVVKDPNVLFLQSEGVFRDSSSLSGVDDVLSHRGAALLDFDRDGDIDIVSSALKLPLASFVGYDQKIRLYQNNVDVGNSIEINLVGVNGVNRDCFGCQAIFSNSGVRSIYEVDGGRGHSSQGTRSIYYGLKDAKKLDEVIVLFPTGKHYVFKDLSCRKTYYIYSDGTITVTKRKRK